MLGAPIYMGRWQTGGAVDPSKLRFPFSHMAEADVRDWHAIREWALALPGLLDARDREPAAV